MGKGLSRPEHVLEANCVSFTVGQLTAMSDEFRALNWKELERELILIKILNPAVVSTRAGF
jgi:hypothetical protein